jgi:hypothetical protein
MTVDASVVVALMLTNEMIGATGVMARCAAAVHGAGEAAGGGEVGYVGDRQSRNERRTLEPWCVGDCYTFCDTAARILLRAMRPLRCGLDAIRPIK